MTTDLQRALRRQRLQIRSAQLRGELARDAAGLVPVFGVAESVRRGALWLRAHPGIALGIVAGVAAARPKVAWRWLRRGYAVWRTWRRLRGNRA